MRAALLGLLTLAAACSELDQPGSEPTTTPAPAPPAAAPPPPPMQTPAPQPAAPRDSCGAAAHAHLVGRNKSEIPVPVDPSRRRVACTTCPITEDLRSDRLNIFYDASTGVITEVRCG